MTIYELEMSRASRYVNQLLSNTSGLGKYKIYISEGEKDFKGHTYCIRVNEMSNRVNNISFMTTLFILKQLSKKKSEICWPEKSSLKKWHNSFQRMTSSIHEYQIANGQADSIIHRCHEWHQP